MNNLMSSLQNFEGENVVINCVGSISMPPIILHDCEIADEGDYIELEDLINENEVRISKKLINRYERTWNDGEIIHCVGGIDFMISENMAD